MKPEDKTFHSANWPMQPLPPELRWPPGRISPPPQPQKKPLPHENFRLWFRLSSPATQLTLVLLGGLLLFSCLCSGALSFANGPDWKVTTTFPTSTPTMQQVPISQATVEVVTLTPTMETPTRVPTPTPNETPTRVPTATPTPKVLTVVPTATPVPAKPTPVPTHCAGVNGNPWCYDFNAPGSYITYPPDGFCGYFNCITTFVSQDDPGDGYVVECQDGAFSQSGGESGACSSHGGVMRPLYSH